MAHGNKHREASGVRGEGTLGSQLIADGSLPTVAGSGFDNLLFEAAISRQLSAVRHSMAGRLLDFEFRIADFGFEPPQHAES